ncbi:MAG: hypothetical protein AAGC67_04445 [Myxococcota bacterium]
MRTRLAALAASFLLGGGALSPVHAQMAPLLVGYDESGLVVEEVTGIVGLDFVRGPGVTDLGGTRFDSGGFDEGNSIPAAFAAEDYWEFGLTVDPGFEVALDTLDIVVTRDGNGPDAAYVVTSLDGFEALLRRNVAIGTGPSRLLDVDVSGFEAVTGTVSFRIYGYDRNGANGRFQLLNDASIVAAEGEGAVAIYGEVFAVPEPAEWALSPTALVAVTGVVRARRAIPLPG